MEMISGLSLKGTPNSSSFLYNPDGSIKQIRIYDSDGYPKIDIDFNHNGKNIKFPHKHTWKNGVRSKEHEPLDWDNEDESNVEKKDSFWYEVVVIGGVVLYVVISEGSRIFFPVRNVIPIP